MRRDWVFPFLGNVSSGEADVGKACSTTNTSDCRHQGSRTGPSLVVDYWIGSVAEPHASLRLVPGRQRRPSHGALVCRRDGGSNAVNNALRLTSPALKSLHRRRILELVGGEIERRVWGEHQRRHDSDLWAGQGSLGRVPKRFTA